MVLIKNTFTITRNTMCDPGWEQHLIIENQRVKRLRDHNISYKNA